MSRFILLSPLVILLSLIVGIGCVTNAPGTTPTIVAAQAVQPAPALSAIRLNIAEIVVDRADDPDDNPDNSFGCSDDPADCPLRNAIELANGSAVPITIRFADNFMITLARPLSALTRSETVIVALPGQEVHVNGNNIAGSVFHIKAANIQIEGLRIYGAGTGFSNIRISGPAHDVVIANNVIGDDDAPAGNCGQSQNSYGGIYINANGAASNSRAWIYGNIIECHEGGPGDGITIATDGVIIGQNKRAIAGLEQQNTIRHNRGYAIRIGNHTGNVVRNTHIHNNWGGSLNVKDFNNNIYDNQIDG